MKIAELKPLLRMLEQHQIEYALGGSGMLHAFGLYDTVHDWDVLVDCTKEQLLDALGECVIVECPSGEFPYASAFRLSLPEWKVDLIGRFAFHTAAGLFHVPVTVSSGSWDGVRLSSLEHWYIAYRFMNREEKAERIKQYLETRQKDIDPRLEQFLEKG